MPLEELGVSPLNRNLSGTHVHKLGRRIVSVEGFVRWRYRNGWAHEPDPENPLEVAQNTNKVARATLLLPEVPEVPLKGSFAKTHLMTFLQSLKSGRMFWNDTKQKMLCPAGQQALIEHVKHGMFYEVFKWEAVKNDRAALVALCKSDNLDSAFALGETEMQLLTAIHSSLEVLRPPVGQSRYEVVAKLVVEQCGQRWTEEDIICIYNFSKTIGAIHLSFLNDAVAVHVPWDDLCVRPQDYHQAARVHASLPWFKCALITAQYFPPENKQLDRGLAGKVYGNMINKEGWEKCAKLDPGPAGVDTPIRQVETFLGYLATMYLGPSSGLPHEKVTLEIPAAFARTAKAVLLAKDMDEAPIDLKRIEWKLRQKLLPATLPPAFSGCDDEDQVEKPKKNSAATSVQPDTLPALTFDGGGVIEDAAVLARVKKLELGGRVCAIRAARGIRKGGQGTLLALTKEAKVAWDAGALVEAAGDGPHERAFPLASLEALKTEAARATAEAAKPKGGAVLELPAGEPWAKVTDYMGQLGISRLVTTTMHMMFARRSAGPDQVMIEAGVPHPRVLCLKDFKPKCLVVFPYVPDLTDCFAKKKSMTIPQVWIKAGPVETGFRLPPPTPDAYGHFWKVSDGGPGDEPPPAAGDAGEAGAGEGESPPPAPPLLDLFWELYNQKGEGRGKLTMTYANVTTTTGFFQIKDPILRIGMGKTGTVEMWFPYLTNDQELRRGDSLGVQP